MHQGCSIVPRLLRARQRCKGWLLHHRDQGRSLRQSLLRHDKRRLDHVSQKECNCNDLGLLQQVTLRRTSPSKYNPQWNFSRRLFPERGKKPEKNKCCGILLGKQLRRMNPRNEPLPQHLATLFFFTYRLYKFGSVCCSACVRVRFYNTVRIDQLGLMSFVNHASLHACAAMARHHHCCTCGSLRVLALTPHFSLARARALSRPRFRTLSLSLSLGSTTV